MNNLTINPTKQINKKEYTPNEIFEEVFVVSLEKNVDYLGEGETLIQRKSEYKLSELVDFFIREKNTKDLTKLLDDYPYAVNMGGTTSEAPIFYAIITKNLEIFKLLKERGADFNSLDFDYMNVYENALSSPDFWSLIFEGLSSDDLYQKLVETKSDCYNIGVFEFLFRGDDYSLDVLKKFKESYPDVFKRIIKEQGHCPKIKSATGELQQIIFDYDLLDKELQEHFYEDISDKCRKKSLKF